MKKEKIYLNYCVIGKYNNNDYIFYKKYKNDKINYRKINKINLINTKNYYKNYDIYTKNYNFKNVICNNKIYTSTNQIEILKMMAKEIIDKPFLIRSYL